MQKIMTLKTAPLLLIIFFLAACSSQNDYTHCFENVYPYQDDSEKKDVLNLSYVLTGDKVTGEFNWLPLEKDKRIGHFEGTEKNGIITAQYYFEQEGISDSTQISITIENQKAIVKEPGSNFGFQAEISKIDCDQ
ncbi:hypothetical protein [Arcticibacterium luteifluviistationis]|uniref:Uncharacterized protein n=1 Tax=Arcticibacterium luteifluviistationis TaxID=1784714 RepID=A0A2Z4GHG8_9BACT|nr:hypothetical protein [Arcticibacterium luteifluviistationis]AWW00369.1 hypothetical protein DJ013_20205 [Arcticibacterium luteifluviistationis]